MTRNHHWNGKFFKFYGIIDKFIISASYAVPQEVGKVGNESPSFIEPISHRKDGIEAMFAKQKQKKDASPRKLSQSSVGGQGSAEKRKRSSSPNRSMRKGNSVIDLVSDDEKKPSRKGERSFDETPDSPRRESPKRKVRI